MCIRDSKDVTDYRDYTLAWYKAAWPWMAIYGSPVSYTHLLDAYARIKEPEKEETQKQERTKEMPEFSVTVESSFLKKD